MKKRKRKQKARRTTATRDPGSVVVRGHTAGFSLSDSTGDRPTRRNQTLERRRRQRAHRRQAIVAALGTREKSGQDQPTQRRSRPAHQAARNRRRRQLRRARRSSQLSREIVNSLVRAVTHRSETTAETVQLLTNRDWHSATTVTGEKAPGNCDQATKGHPAADWVAVHPQGEPIGSVQRGKDDGVLLIVTARLFGHECRALIDSGATRSFVTPAAVLRCGLHSIHQETLLELADGRTLLSQGQCPHVLVGVSSRNCKVDLTVCPLMKNIDVILGVNWL